MLGMAQVFEIPKSIPSGMPPVTWNIFNTYQTSPSINWRSSMTLRGPFSSKPLQWYRQLQQQVNKMHKHSPGDWDIK